MTARFQPNLLAGVLTVVPIGLTVWILNAVINLLTAFGKPFVMAAGRWLEPTVPAVAAWIEAPWIQSVMAIVAIVVGLYLLGLAASAVIGKRILAALDLIMSRIPIVQLIYGSARKLVAVVQERPENLQRVVLIEFPSPEMKTIGLVTRTFIDARSGQTLAAVYVPTTPNPTSGYIELVPIDKLIPLDWTPNDAMGFIMSGGAVGPDHIDFGIKSADAANP